MKANAPDWVFAYGSNMALDDLRAWFAQKGYLKASILGVEPATLPGYRLVWNYYSKSRKGGAANVEPCTDNDLPGLALAIDARTLGAIDEKEGHPSYYNRGSSRRTITLRNDKTVEAWVYIATPEKQSENPVWPRREYLHLLINAAKQYALPSWHIAELEGTPTAAE